MIRSPEPRVAEFKGGRHNLIRVCREGNSRKGTKGLYTFPDERNLNGKDPVGGSASGKEAAEADVLRPPLRRNAGVRGSERRRRT